MIRLIAITLALTLAQVGPPAQPPYKNASLPVDVRVADLLGRMTLEEKFWQVFMIPGSLDDPAHDYSNGIFGLQISTGGVQGAPAGRAHAERINSIQRYFVERTRLGIPIIPFEEALHGLSSDGAIVFPQAIGLAATWDTDLMRRVSAASARETASRGIRMVLSPVVNIADDVRWGRVEETYGEDPYLSAEMGRAFIETFERAGIITTPKHWVANVGEGGRDSYPIDHSERILAERFFPPFEVALREAGARSLMTAYNSVDGHPATQSPRLMNGIVKGEWGFKGFIISDASATGGATVLHMTEPNTPTATKDAFEAGLDVVFQSQYGQQRSYLQAFQQGMIAQPIIDAAVSRVLRAKFELGLFEQPYVNVDDAARWNGHADHRALAREAAQASLVLLRNEGPGRPVLPIDPAVRSIAVIGTDAVEARLGGYSGPGIAKVSILDGLRQRAGTGVQVRHVNGPGRIVREFDVIPAEQFSTVRDGKSEPGVTGEYWANNSFTGAPQLTRVDPRIDFRWTLSSPGRGIPFDWYSARWTTTLTVPDGGVRRLAVEGNDGYRLTLNGRVIIDNWRKQSYGTRVVDVSLPAGSMHALRLEFYESTGIARLRLLWDAGVEDTASASIAAAVTLAEDSHLAVVVAGLEEGEFRDRAFLKLPGRQEELIRAVAATGTPTVVVIIGGSATTMSPWIDQVGAVVQAWYPGEMGGAAVADVLFGDVSPGGRLPITFPMSEGQLPLHYNHKPTGRGDDYLDLNGMPLFPFGFGLSYTTFAYSDLRITPGQMTASGTATVTCTVRNTGTRVGDEVVQLYIRDVLGSVARPVMELKGFRRVRLAPGESRDVTFTLEPRHLRMLDADRRWIVEPGVFRVMVGASSEDIRLRGELIVK